MSLIEIFSLLGGVGLFLYGMSIMSAGLKNAAGEKLASILAHATSNRVAAVFVGLLVTVLIQSSSATDMMVIGFVNSGLMTLAQAIGVILGANIGTTVTAQITAFDIGMYAPVILFVGACMHLFMKSSMKRHIGAIIMGFGMLFVGIAIIKAAIAPLSQNPEFIVFLQNLSNPALAILFGVLFTALLQSSSSATVIFQAFAIQGIITFDVAIYLVIGAAIGSVTPNLLASLTTNRNGKRTALLNLLFNLIRAAILVTLIAIIPAFADWIQSLSPNDIGRQIANAHTIFAIIAVAVVLPFTPKLVALAQLIIPFKADEKRRMLDHQLLYMVQSDNLPPALALQQAKLEIVRLGRIARDNLKMSIDCFFKNDSKLAQEVEETEETVNFLTHAITNRLVLMRSLDMSPKEMERVSKLTLVAADIERLSDHAENVVEYEAQIHSNKTKFSPDALKDLQKIADAALESVDLSLFVFEQENFDLLPQAESQEQYVDVLQEKIINNHITRLLNAQCEPLAGVIFTNFASDLERCSDHAINIACALHEYYAAASPADTNS